MFEILILFSLSVYIKTSINLEYAWANEGPEVRLRTMGLKKSEREDKHDLPSVPVDNKWVLFSSVTMKFNFKTNELWAAIKFISRGVITRSLRVFEKS